MALARAGAADAGGVPLSLYVHLPWCVRKCPYCDFNSHRAPAALPEAHYVDALVADLRAQAPSAAGRAVRTVFFGGGTPSLFTPESIARVIDTVRAEIGLAPGAEITLEANPGASDAARFEGFLRAGVTRLSIGVQSFHDGLLERVGRIHDGAASRAAVHAAREAGFERMNLDLMYALPGQDADMAAADLAEAIALDPGHVSLYHLTLEPGTPFHRTPPALPGDEEADAMHDAALAALESAGYGRYEISAYARAGHRCRHNLNYWRFGDYLGVGAGAHGKLTDAGDGPILRTVRERHPTRYADALRAAGIPPDAERVPRADVPFEFALNAARLVEGFDLSQFEAHTGCDARVLMPALARAAELGLVRREGAAVRPTSRGMRFHNDLVMLFMADGGGPAGPDSTRPIPGPA